MTYSSKSSLDKDLKDLRKHLGTAKKLDRQLAERFRLVPNAFFKFYVLDHPQQYLKDYFDLVDLYPKNILWRLSDELKLAFFDNVGQSVFEMLPLEKRNAKDIRLISYEFDINNPALRRLTAPFSSKDDLHLPMMALNFDDSGIVATDATKLLFIPYKGRKSDFRGLYCLNKRCLKANDDELSVKKAFPNYKAVIPKSFKYKFDLDLSALLNACHVVTSTRLFENQSDRLFIRMESNEYICFNIDNVLKVAVQTLMKLGYSRAFLRMNEKVSPAVLSPARSNSELSKLEEIFTLIMPMRCNDPIITSPVLILRIQH